MNDSTEKDGSEVPEAPKCKAVPMDTKGRGDEQKIWYDWLGGQHRTKTLEEETQGGNAKIRL